MKVLRPSASRNPFQASGNYLPPSLRLEQAEKQVCAGNRRGEPTGPEQSLFLSRSGMSVTMIQTRSTLFVLQCGRCLRLKVLLPDARSAPSLANAGRKPFQASGSYLPYRAQRSKLWTGRSRPHTDWSEKDQVRVGNRRGEPTGPQRSLFFRMRKSVLRFTPDARGAEGMCAATPDARGAGGRARPLQD